MNKGSYCWSFHNFTHIWHEGCNFLSIFNQLYTAAFTDCRVWLFCLDTAVRLSPLVSLSFVAETLVLDQNNHNRNHVQYERKTHIHTHMHTLTHTCFIIFIQYYITSLHFLEHDSFRVRAPCKWFLPLWAEVGLTVVFVCPQLVSAQDTKLSPRSQSVCLSHVSPPSILFLFLFPITLCTALLSPFFFILFLFSPPVLPLSCQSASPLSPWCPTALSIAAAFFVSGGNR